MNCCCFELEFEEISREFCFEFTEQENEFCFEFGDVTIIHVGGEIYPGPYEVIPHRWDQVLDTDGKLMNGDVTVKEVPWIEVSNPEGTTYIIASD